MKFFGNIAAFLLMFIVVVLFFVSMFILALSVISFISWSVAFPFTYLELLAVFRVVAVFAAMVGIFFVFSPEGEDCAREFNENVLGLKDEN